MKSKLLLLGIVSFLLFSQRQCVISNSESVDTQRNLQARTDSSNQDPKRLNPHRFETMPEKEIDGEQVKVLLIGIAAFNKESKIPAEKKGLENYKLELRQDVESFFLSFWAKRDANKVYIGGETEKGIDVTYVIDKKNQEVKTRVFYK